jgi:cell wall-associated NlpC family hydrolase
MAPGGPTRRARALVVALAALATASVAGPAWAAQAPDYRGGDTGSGLPPVPIVEPRVTARAGTIRWADVTSEHAWARTAIDLVAGTERWMRDFKPLEDGTYPFKPDAIASRRHVARAIVRAFAPTAEPDPSISFADLEEASPFWRFANVAVAKGWMTTAAGQAFRPADPITTKELHRALVYAVGLRPAARALNRIRSADGERFPVPPTFGTNVLALRLNLRHATKWEDHDVHPWTPLPRVQVAYSLYRAATQAPSTIAWLAGQYDDVVLPRMGETRRRIVRWGIRFAGYPYVWGGEWGLRAPAPSALGGQSIPGFDCSGFAWWLMRRNDDSAWKVAPPRPYRGWALPERSSATMAGATRERLAYEELRPGDLMFYDGDGDRVVDHVDVYVGRGWALDSSFTPAGVTLMWVGSGWYRDHFVHGRRIAG